MIFLVMLLHDNSVFNFLYAFLPICFFNSSSFNILIIASANAFESLGGTTNPVTPSSTTSFNAPTSVTTTGFLKLYATGTTPLCVI